MGNAPYKFQWQTQGGIITTDSIFITTPGEYGLTVMDANGCEGIAQNIMVTEFDSPSVDLGPDSIQVSEITLLQAGVIYFLH